MTAPWEKYAQGDGPWSQYAGSETPAQPAPAPAPEPAAPPRREVGFVESAGRTAGASAIPVVKMFGLAAATAARLFGRKAQDKVFEAMDRVTGSMEREYRPQAGEEFSTAGQFAGGLASLPVEIAGGFGLQHGVERAQEVVQRGGTVGEAGKAGAVTGGVRVALNALPVKVGGAVGRVVENAAGRVIGGGLTGAGIVGITGTAGRAAENAALPEGEQFSDLRQNVAPSVAELGLGAAFGAVPGALAAAQTLRGAAETPVRELPRKVPAAENPAGGLAKRAVQPNPALLEAVPAAEKAGLTVLPHHVAEGETVRALGTAAGGAAYKQNTKAFTKALIKELDPEEASARLDTKTFHRVLDKQGKTIGENMAKYDMPVDDALRARLEAISKDAADNADADTGRMTMNRVREIIGKAEAGEGQITGQAVRELDTAIGRQIRSNTKNQDLVARLRSVQDVLRDTAERQMSPDEAKAVQQARRRYAYAMEILPDIDDFGRTGYYEPGQLWKRLTGSEAGRQRVANERGGLTDLAKAGALVADRSGTGHGYVSVGSNSVGVGAGGMRAYASPNMMLKLATGGVVGEKAYNRFGPGLVKRLAAEHDAELARVAQKPEPPPLELAAPDAPTPQGPRPDVRGEAPAEVPEWTAEAPDRVARPGDQIPAIEPEGLLPAVGDDMPPARIIHGAGETRRVAPATRTVDPEDPGALPREEAPRKLRGPNEPAVTTAGQVAAQRAAQPPLVERTPAEIGEGSRRPRVPDIPAVPGRPDMPDVMVAGAPGDVAGNLASGVTGAGKKGPIREAPGMGGAMQAPEAALAREQQGYAPKKPEPPAGGGGGGGTPPTDPRLAKIAELRRQAPSQAVKKVLDAREAEIKKVIKRETDIAELEAAARATDDVDLRQSLLAEANKLRGGKLPVGEVTEGMPDLPKPKTEKIPVGKVIEGQPDLPVGKTEKIPVGEATEITPEVVEPAPESIPVGEATEMPEPLPVGEVVEDPIPVGDAMEFEQMPVGEATELTPEVVEPKAAATESAANEPVVPEATNVDNAPTAPAGGGRSEGMEQTKGGYAAAKEAWEKVKARSAAAADALKKYPKGPNGMTPDAVKKTEAWRRDYAEYEQAFANERKWNASMLRKYGAEIRTERQAAREAKVQPAPAPQAPAGGGAGTEPTKSIPEPYGSLGYKRLQYFSDGKPAEGYSRFDFGDPVVVRETGAKGTVDGIFGMTPGGEPTHFVVQTDIGRIKVSTHAIDPAQENTRAPQAPAGGAQPKITHAGMEIEEIPGKGGEPTRWQVTVPETGERVQTPSGLDAAKRIAENERKMIERHGTRPEREKAAEAARAAEEQARADAKKARSAETAGKSLAEIKAMDHMNRTIRADGKDMKAHEFVDARLAAGDVPKVEMVDRVAPMSRRAFNRASGAEQRAHEAKVKAAGKKESYWLGGYGLSKTEYDYAVKKDTARAPQAPAGGEQPKATPEPSTEAPAAVAPEKESWKRMSATEYRLSDPSGGGDLQIVKKGSNWLNPDTGEKWPTLDGAMRGVRRQIAQEAKTRADEAASRTEVGPEPVKTAPAAKPAPRTEAPAGKPTGKAMTPAEVKAEFQRQIDAVARFDAGGPETITLKAGGSSARIQNTARRVAEYMKELDKVKDKKYVAEKKAGIGGTKATTPADNRFVGSEGSVALKAKTWGGALSRRAPLKSITDMIDDFDSQAAVDFAAAQGIDLEEALKGDRKRLDRVRGLKPTPPDLNEGM